MNFGFQFLEVYRGSKNIRTSLGFHVLNAGVPGALPWAAGAAIVLCILSA